MASELTQADSPQQVGAKSHVMAACVKSSYFHVHFILLSSVCRIMLTWNLKQLNC